MLFFGNVEQKWLTKQCKGLGKKHILKETRENMGRKEEGKENKESEK